MEPHTIQVFALSVHDALEPVDRRALIMHTTQSTQVCISTVPLELRDGVAYEGVHVAQLGLKHADAPVTHVLGQGELGAHVTIGVGESGFLCIVGIFGIILHSDIICNLLVGYKCYCAFSPIYICDKHCDKI